MRVLRVIFLTTLTVVLLSATAYGAGYAVRHLASDDPSSGAPAAAARDGAAAVDDAQRQPVAPDPKETKPKPPPFRIGPRDAGKQVRELQHRLFQIAWFPEKTTGKYDAATKEAVRGFQRKRGIRATGVVDKRTWNRLLAMTEEPTHDQLFNILRPGPRLHGPGDSGDEVRDLQARLKQIAWISGPVTGTYDATTEQAVRGFQRKRGIPVTGEVDQRTLDRLYAMTRTPTDDELHNRPASTGSSTEAPLDDRCLTGRVLCIDKSSRTLRWVVDGKVLKTLDVRFGSTINDTPTREGTFSVYWKDVDHVSNEYGSAMPFSMFFSGGQAVHYSSDFAARGYSGASHGCVNVRDYDGLAWLFDQVQVGDRVVVYWS